MMDIDKFLALEEKHRGELFNLLSPSELSMLKFIVDLTYEPMGKFFKAFTREDFRGRTKWEFDYDEITLTLKRLGMLVYDHMKNGEEIYRLNKAFYKIIESTYKITNEAHA